MTPPTNTPFVTIILLWLAGLGAAAQYGKAAVTYDQFAYLYPNAGAAAAFIVSLVGFVGIAFGVVAGLLVARIRYKRALVWGLWLGAAMSAWQALTPAFGWMLVSRGIEGASHLLLVVAAPTLIAGLSAPHHRGLTLSLWSTFFGVAFAVLTWGGLPLVEHYGVAALFWVHAAWMAAFAIILQSVLPRLQAEPPKEALSLSKLIHEHSVIYRSASISAAGWGWLFYTFSFVSILTLLPPFLDPSERALVMGAMPLVSIAVSLSIGVWMMRILSAVQVIQIGFVISALCAVLLGVWQGQAVLCLCLAGALGLVQGASFAAVPQLNDMPATQAQANGAMAQMGNIGNTIGTPVMAAMIAGFGYKGMILSAVVTLLAGAWVHYRLAGRRAV